MNHLGCIEEKAIKTIFAAANMNSTFDTVFKQKNVRFPHKITFVVLSRYVILEQSKPFVI